jgi:hypothetical protein
MMHAIRKPSLVLAALFLGGYACSSAPSRPTETGGTGGDEGGTGGSETSTGGKTGENTGGAPSTGGKGGDSTGGSPGTGGSMTPTGGSGGSSGSGGSEPPPDASAGGSGGAGGGGPGGMPTVVLLYSSDHNASDPSLKDMMAVLNEMKDHLTPEFILDSDPKSKAAMLKDKGLVIVGPNTRACTGGVDTAIKDLAIPVMISKDCTSWAGIGNMMNTGNTENSINIVKSDHPLAAGLSGKVRVFTDNVCRLVRGGGLGPDAIKIAQFDANTWNIFAYEKGGMMPGGKAPAKRMGFYWHRPSGGTPEGKKLFKAAVDWMLAP